MRLLIAILQLFKLWREFRDMSLTLAQIDRLLTDWQQKASAANQNLLDLSDLAAYQRLSGMGNPPSNVTGITQQKVSTALTAIDRLFEEIELLNLTLDRSQKLRKELPSFFLNDSDLGEIEQLLTGQSIQLSSTQVPLAQRDLLSSNLQVQKISLDGLLDLMITNFTIARNTFISIETAWSELESQLIGTHQSLIELKQLAEKLRVTVPASLIIAETNFTNLQLQLDRDPLGVNYTFTQDLTPLINDTRRELESLHRQRQQLQADFASAPRYLQELRQIDRDSIEAYTASHAKITHILPVLYPLPAEELIELERWLERLVTKFESGLIPPVRVGLTNWLSKVQSYTISAQSALAANRLPLDTRQELRGRLDALTAKALAKGKAEDPILADLAIQARQILYNSPTDLNLATNLVKSYEQRLNLT
jgi:DNA-binding transcriptional MerR regulator